jgi:hypothetical protein
MIAKIAETEKIHIGLMNFAILLVHCKFLIDINFDEQHVRWCTRVFSVHPID